MVSLAELGGTYRVHAWGVPKAKEKNPLNPTKPWTLDLLAGGRWTSVDLDLKVLDIPVGKTSESWIDPFFGVLIDGVLSEKWSLSMRGDIGGFGVGSDFSWNAYAILGYRINRRLSLVGGYKALRQDFEQGSGTHKTKWDATLHGPILGLTIHF
jgi:hypothetical protein